MIYEPRLLFESIESQDLDKSLLWHIDVVAHSGGTHRGFRRDFGSNQAPSHDRGLEGSPRLWMARKAHRCALLQSPRFIQRHTALR